ncbi:MAG: hypothetical protein JO089_09190, partial [Alphaproteobacteria bacterium]|nr:hypothetical protein [Alphaproteobacteria bacterium]
MEFTDKGRALLSIKGFPPKYDKVGAIIPIVTALETYTIRPHPTKRVGDSVELLIPARINEHELNRRVKMAMRDIGAVELTDTRGKDNMSLAQESPAYRVEGLKDLNEEILRPILITFSTWDEPPSNLITLNSASGTSLTGVERNSIIYNLYPLFANKGITLTGRDPISLSRNVNMNQSTLHQCFAEVMKELGAKAESVEN